MGEVRTLESSTTTTRQNSRCPICCQPFVLEIPDEGLLKLMECEHLPVIVCHRCFVKLMAQDQGGTQ